MANLPVAPFSSGSGDVNIHDLNKRKILTLKLKTAPVAIQSLRRSVIVNANEMIQELKKYRFNEISEIVRVCTALGIERAYLRGLTKSIASEEDIDKYIYRFNLNGALPFQDITNISASNWVGGGEFAERAFFYGTKNTILLQCIRQDGEPFFVCNGSDIEVVHSDPPELPLTAFIPKYRPEGAHPNLPWLPNMKCDFLFNIPDPEECITTTDISSTSNQTPDLNELIPVNVNPFPYTTPNRGFPFYKVVNPAPKPIRMVMDGSPVDGEKVIIANRFELSGTVEISIGDSITGQLVDSGNADLPTEFIPDTDGVDVSNTDVIVVSGEDLDGSTGTGDDDITPDTDQADPADEGDPDVLDPDTGDTGDPTPQGSPATDDGTGDPDPTPPETGDGDTLVTGFKPTPNTFPIVVTDGRFLSPTQIVNPYAGRMFIQRDPVVGTDTRFDEELYPNDIVELQYSQRGISGLFYTVGSDRLYYKGTEFQGVYRPNIEIVLSNIRYRVTAKNETGGTLSYYGYTFDYDAIFLITKLQDNYIENSANQIPSNLFSSVSETVNVFPASANKRLGNAQFPSGFNVENYFEMGDLIQINGVYYRFRYIDKNSLKNVYRVDGGELNQTINNATLTRAAKLSRALPNDEFSQAFVLPYRMYYRVGTINSAESITVSPGYGMSNPYEGKLYRIGFNIRSVSQSPDLINTGFNVDGVAQFLPDGAATDNSPVFFVPKAATEKVILYNQAAKSQLTSVPAGMSSKTALPVLTTTSALTGKYMNSVYNYTTFSQPLDTVIFPSDYNPIYDEEEKGQIYFTDGDDKYIILETIYNDNPVSHGFAAGDRLEIRKVKYNPDPVKDDPYGDFIRHNDSIFSTHMNSIDYDDCGMLIEVADTVNPHRFKVLKEGYSCSSKANEFFHAYDESTTYFLTATNGTALEYWAKYFSPVYMDGTITANSYGEYIIEGGNVQRTLNLCSKATRQEKLKFNYNDDEFQVSYWLGSTGVNIEMIGDVVNLTPGAAGSSGAHTSNDGTFIWSLKDDVVHPPNLLDTFLLKAVEYEYVEI